MAEHIDNLMLEHLRHIRGAVDELRLDVIDIKTRLTATEATMAQIVTLLAVQSSRIDRLDERVGRIERRLELTAV